MIDAYKLSSIVLAAALVHCSAPADSASPDDAMPAASDDGSSEGEPLRSRDAGRADSQSDARATTADGAAHDGAAVVDAGPLPPAARVTLVSGGSHNCAILATGAVKCWGLNDYGQLGLGDKNSRGDDPGEMGGSLPAVNLGPGRTAVSLAAGHLFSCAILDNGSVRCWGNNAVGQLGLGDTNDRGDQAGEMGASLPAVDLGAGRTAVSIVTGGAHTCVILDDGTTKCWGYNAYGQLGLGNTQNRGDGAAEMGAALPVVDLGPGRRALALAAGDRHTCARLDNGTVKCWGGNDGALGLGDGNGRGFAAGQMGASLLAVDLGGSAVVDISAPAYSSSGFLNVTHTCAVLAGGAVKCWGFNYQGELGIGSTTAHGANPGEMGASLPAVNLGAGKTALQTVVGASYTCARLTDGAVKCWGYNGMGQLGLGDLVNRGASAADMGNALPELDLGTGRTAVHLSATYRHTCARLDNGAIRCWGANGVGELGVGDKVDRGGANGQMGNALPVVALQ